jgi:hypothetical protein
VKPKPVSAFGANLAVMPSFLTSAEVQAVLRCSKMTLYRYYRGYETKKGTFKRPILSHIRREGRVLFAKSEVVKFLTARMVLA